MSKRMSWAKMVEIAKSRGVKNCTEGSLRKAIDCGMVPESIFHGDKALVHVGRKGEEFPAADCEPSRSWANADEKEAYQKEQQAITDDLKQQLYKQAHGEGKITTQFKERDAEEVAGDYFESPAGQRFDNPAFHRELHNMNVGNPVDYKDDPKWREADKKTDKEMA